MSEKDITPIAQANPGAGYVSAKEEIDRAIVGVLRGGRYILGPEVTAFEKAFSDYIGVRHAVGTGTGTDAVEIALRACGIGKGDPVITVSHTAVATIVAIERAGAVPCLVDIEPGTFTMDPHAAAEAASMLSEGKVSGCGTAKALVPVHLYGHASDMGMLLDLANRHGFLIVEDCAQSHGGAWQGRKTGTLGAASAFSFYPTKNLGAFGDGGAVVTDRAEVAKRALMLREYGWKERYVSEEVGMNSRLDEVQAAILRVKLDTLERENDTRRKIAGIYERELLGTAARLPKTTKGVKHVFHQYVIRVPSRDRLRAYLQREGIGTAIHYPVPVHLQPAYRGRLPVLGRLSETEKACGEILSLPMYAQLSEAEAVRVADTIRRGLAGA